MAEDAGAPAAPKAPRPARDPQGDAINGIGNRQM
jgi:hypothetical protein